MRRILLVAVLALVGCGGDARQDADEPSGEFKVEIVDASFPRVQRIAENVELKIKVRNGESDESLRNGLKYLTSLPPTALTLARQMLHEGGTMDYRKAYEAYKAAQFHALHQLEEAG